MMGHLSCWDGTGAETRPLLWQTCPGTSDFSEKSSEESSPSPTERERMEKPPARPLPGPTDRQSLPPTRWWPLGNTVLTQVQQGRDNWTRTEPRGRPRWESAPQTGGSGQGNPTRSIGLCPTQVYGQIHLKQQEMQSLSRKSQSTAKALRRHNKDTLGGPIVAQHE